MQGITVGQYCITGLLGQGGMGTVYSAQHMLLKRPAAVKLLRPELSSDQEMVIRFFNEARAAAAIHHPSIVEIYDFGWHTDGSAYLVMEHLDGESLAARLARGRMTAPAVMTIARQIAGALAAAHGKGIVHRDLKPENVFLVPDAEVAAGERIKLLDFGIAKLCADADRHTTRTGAILGTPTYMAPEQCRGVAVDHRADLYSLGCILFEAYTGRPPFIGEGAGDILAAHIYVPPPALSSVAADAPPELVAVIEQLLIKDRAARTQSADAVALAVARGATPTFALGSGPRAPIAPQAPSTTTISTSDTAVEPSVRGPTRLVRIGFAAAAAVALSVAIHARARRSAEATGSPSAPAAALVAESSSAAPSAAPTEAARTPDLGAAPAQDDSPAVEELLAYDLAGAPRTGAPPHRPPGRSPPPASPSPPPPPSTSLITAASIVQHYIDVGRKIRVLAENRGAGTASKLWESFRYIRINDAILDPAKRGETDARLRRIDDALAAIYAR